ncbi:dihydropteroate synthase [Streptomyces mirabilis]|uniref:dihydropteroate synthase n=1 Tax=Streptomyces mirabilis TaxID=68239 RepID=UPI0036495A19
MVAASRSRAGRGLSRHRVRRQPAQERLLTAAGGTVSVDTMRAEVATRALDAGARLVNDVSGGLADPAMLPLMARADMSYVAMHWRGHAAGMQPNAVYVDVVDELRPRIEAAS